MTSEVEKENDLADAGEEGTTIYASASGTVESVYTDAEIGNAVKLNIGGAYEILQCGRR